MSKAREDAIPVDPADGRTAHSPESLEGMLGWNSVGIFSNAEHVDEETGTLHVNKGIVFVVLADPYPEYSEFVLLDGEFHHSGTLLRGEYEGMFTDYFENYGSATVHPLPNVPCIERDENGIPRWVSE